MSKYAIISVPSLFFIWLKGTTLCPKISSKWFKIKTLFKSQNILMKTICVGKNKHVVSF